MNIANIATNLLEQISETLEEVVDAIKTTKYGREDDPRPVPRIQFILKHREVIYEDEDPCYSYTGTLHSGLYNSARFMSDMLNKYGYDSECIHVQDNNCIDREVTRYKPDICVIEAFWVVPEKFEVLTKLHPNIKWIIRNHSKVPFLANEGIAFDWAVKYTNYPNVYISSNAANTNDDIAELIYGAHADWSMEDALARCPYLPNYYPIEDLVANRCDYVRDKHVLNVGCFGAVRPLKNHVIQAIAAIKYADRMNKHLRFHINGTRIENNGNNVLKNLRSVFANSPHELVEHSWMPHDQFLKLVGTMDIGLQVSYTETFNIVAADMVSQGVPVVGSDEIEWIDKAFHANPNETEDIVAKMNYAYRAARVGMHSLKNAAHLEQFNHRTVAQWKKVIKALTGR